jgi:2,5-diketo-D-gluconate reductase A
MPVVGLGTWQLKHQTADSVARALAAGYRMIDTSGDYHTQRGIGEALRANDIPREFVYVVTKVEQSGNAYEALRTSLAELRLDYVDLVLVHRPPERGVGEALWQNLRRAKREQMTRDIGVSNYTIEQIEELVYRTGELPVVNQIEWTPFGHSPRMLDFCHDNHIVIQAWSPLTHGKRLNDDKLTAMAFAVRRGAVAEGQSRLSPARQPARVRLRDPAGRHDEAAHAQRALVVIGHAAVRLTRVTAPTSR